MYGLIILSSYRYTTKYMGSLFFPAKGKQQKVWAHYSFLLQIHKEMRWLIISSCYRYTAKYMGSLFCLAKDTQQNVWAHTFHCVSVVGKDNEPIHSVVYL